MAVREEFEYISFRCCYCYHLNPARKKRPAAPKLEIDSKTSRIKQFSSSDSDKISESDSENEGVIQKPMESHAKTSDTEKTSDFDKLSDLDVKNSDSESPQPMDVDNSAERGSSDINSGDTPKTEHEEEQVQTLKEDWSKNA